MGTATPAESLLLTKKQVAGMLNCSDRHVENMARDGRMPKSVNLGSAVRWDRDVITDWIKAGCPRVDSDD